MTTRMEYVRQMPGRIVGRTLDVAGHAGFTLTLQAREQHIRRAKATSNICTNQGLLVTAATIYLSLMGPQGLARTAAAAHARTRELVAALTRVPGVRLALRRARTSTRRCCSSIARWRRCSRRSPRAASSADWISAGYYPELGHALLVCATETKTPSRHRALPRRARRGDCRRRAPPERPARITTMPHRKKSSSSTPLPGRGASDQWPRRSGRRRRSPTCREAAPRAARRCCPRWASSRRCATSRACRSSTSPSTRTSIRSARAR